MLKNNPSNLTLDTPSDTIYKLVASELVIESYYDDSLIAGVSSQDSIILILTSSFNVIGSIEAVAGVPWSYSVSDNELYVIALNNVGSLFTPNHHYVSGDIIYPSVGNGFAYRIVKSGRSGNEEPVWWFPSIRDYGSIGTAEAIVVDSSLPVCHGPIMVRL